MSNCVVVGGGVCGLLAAYLMRQRGHEVVLVEQAKHCGGLLRSVQDDEGNYYDQGTHIPNLTGHAELDEILFGPKSQWDEHWLQISNLQTGNYFKGTWDFETQTIDARKLDQQDYERGLGQLLANTSHPLGDNIEAYCNNSIGEVFFSQLAKPIIRKLYGSQIDCKTLSSKSSINYFGATRLLALDEPMTRKLKQISEYDTRLGFHSREAYSQWMKEQDIAETTYMYPKSYKGCQAWVEYLIEKVCSIGVKVLSDVHITGMTTRASEITEISISNGEKISCDWVYWSAPPVFALRFLTQEVSSFRPKLRTANVFHFTVDKPLKNSQSHYLWNWDESSDVFRITLYPNLNSARCHSITAEVLSDMEQADTLCEKKIFTDLIDMQLIAPDSKVVSSTRQTIHNTFPVPTHEFNQHISTQFEQLHHLVSNISISGRFSGKLWLLNDILCDTYQTIEKQFGR